MRPILTLYCNFCAKSPIPTPPLPAPFIYKAHPASSGLLRLLQYSVSPSSRVSYPALAVMHLFTVLRRWAGFLDPFAINDRGFPIHRNQVIDLAVLAVLAVLAALILLIDRDRWSVDAWWRARHT
jgi:hypothetical protein